MVRTLKLTSELTETERIRLAKAARRTRPTAPQRIEFARLMMLWRERRAA
jgi:hypothetical protein